MLIVWSWLRNSVVPSAGAAFSACAASWPPAPGLFSTITLAFSAPRSFSASVRAIASVPPPAGKPTRMRMVLSDWAVAAQANSASAAVALTVAKRRRVSECMGRVLAKRSDVEQEIQHIAVLDDVLLAFGAHLAGVLRALLALVGNEVVEGDGLRADEAALEVGDRK